MPSKLPPLLLVCNEESHNPEPGGVDEQGSQGTTLPRTEGIDCTGSTEWETSTSWGIAGGLGFEGFRFLQVHTPGNMRGTTFL